MKRVWNISIHAPREGGDDAYIYRLEQTDISIHAPREGGDLGQQLNLFHGGISIHAPREGGDVTDSRGLSTVLRGNFNPRPPRGGRHPLAFTPLAPTTEISIHAPREGGDPNNGPQEAEELRISIHAPREGGDSKDAQFYL